MNTLERDIEFQNESRTLRVAPWLDMPKLRLAVQSSLSSQVEDGEFDYAFEEFREDILNFCAGEYRHMPRSSALIDILSNVMYETCPNYRTDPKQSRALNRISQYILQANDWRVDRRVGLEEAS
jgi:hypothetical protein